MEILNVGPWEFVFILLIALIVLGPDNMAKTGRTMGRYIYKLIRSPIWAQIMSTSRELRDLPTKIVREAGLEESLKELQEETKTIGGSLTKDLSDVANEANAVVREASDQVSFAAATGTPRDANAPSSGDSGQDAGREDSPESPPMQEGDQPAEAEPGDEQIPTDTPLDKVIPKEGAKVAPAIIDAGDSGQIREEMAETAAKESLEKPQPDENIDNPEKEDVPPPAIIDVDRAASFGDTFIEPFEKSTLVENQDETASPEQPLEERPVEQWRERQQEQQQEKEKGAKKNADLGTGKDREKSQDK